MTLMRRAAAGWDDIDHILLDACRTEPTLNGLIDHSGLTGDVVKSLLHGYVTAGWVTTFASDGIPDQSEVIRYLLTITGLQHLTMLSNHDTHTKAA